LKIEVSRRHGDKKPVIIFMETSRLIGYLGLSRDYITPTSADAHAFATFTDARTYARDHKEALLELSVPGVKN